MSTMGLGQFGVIIAVGKVNGTLQMAIPRVVHIALAHVYSLSILQDVRDLLSARVVQHDANVTRILGQQVAQVLIPR
jgi:hypothetical protein